MFGFSRDMFSGRERERRKRNKNGGDCFLKWPTADFLTNKKTRVGLKRFFLSQEAQSERVISTAKYKCVRDIQGWVVKRGRERQGPSFF